MTSAEEERIERFADFSPNRAFEELFGEFHQSEVGLRRDIRHTSLAKVTNNNFESG